MSQPQRTRSGPSYPANAVILVLAVLLFAYFWWRGGLIQDEQVADGGPQGIAATSVAAATAPPDTPAMKTQEPAEDAAQSPAAEPAGESVDQPAPEATVEPTEEPPPTATATPAPTPAARASDLPAIDYAGLPPEAHDTIALIDAGGPFPFDKDGSIFQNREGILPGKARGYYSEYTVITPGSDDRGARRIVAGEDGELYYTDDHYDSFREVLR